MLFPYNILAFTEIGLPPTYVYVQRMGIVIMPECCVNASLFLIAELRPANFSDAFLVSKIVSSSTAKNPCVHGKEICIHLFYSRESKYLVVCPRLLHIKTTRMNVQSFVATYSVIQFENGGCLHHSHLNPQNVNLSPARVFTGAHFLWFCEHLESKSISLMSVQI